MTDSSNWSIEQFKHFQETGETPEDVIKADKRRAKCENREEAEFQKICEQWLHHRGYSRLTAENAKTRRVGHCGWFGHLVNALKNPLLPDLLIFNDKMDRCLMLELKVRPVYQPGQKELIDAGTWNLCFTFEEVEAAVIEWEAGL